MKLRKFFACAIFAFFSLGGIFAEETSKAETKITEQSEIDTGIQELFVDKGNFGFTVTYKKSNVPGEVFFLRMLVESKKQGKKIDINAKAELFNRPTETVKETDSESDESEKSKEIKPVCKSDFYYLDPFKKNHKNVAELLTGLPMWTWDKDCSDASIKITYTINGEEENYFEIPVVIEPKDYPKETIKLNSALSDLISKPDPEKKEQSKQLNEILATIDPKGVYDTKPFIRPMGGKRITSEFGQTRTFVYSNGKKAPSYHCGLDFGIPEGTQVVACAGGKVVMARWRIVTGYSVIIEHLPGLYSIYYHLSELKCSEGDIVKQGDLIALSGCTGLSTGPHLHWEIRLNSVCVNPDFFMSNYAFDFISKDSKTRLR